MRDEAGIGAVGQDRGWAAGGTAAKRQCAFTQRVIGTRRWRQAGIGIAAGPRLDARIQIERASFLAQFDQRNARDVDRDVEEKIALSELWLEQRAVVAASQCGFDKADPVFGC